MPLFARVLRQQTAACCGPLLLLLLLPLLPLPLLLLLLRRRARARLSPWRLACLCPSAVDYIWPDGRLSAGRLLLAGRQVAAKKKKKSCTWAALERPASRANCGQGVCPKLHLAFRLDKAQNLARKARDELRWVEIGGSFEEKMGEKLVEIQIQIEIQIQVHQLDAQLELLTLSCERASKCSSKHTLQSALLWAPASGPARKLSSDCLARPTDCQWSQMVPIGRPIVLLEQTLPIHYGKCSLERNKHSSPAIINIGHLLSQSRRTSSW